VRIILLEVIWKFKCKSDICCRHGHTAWFMYCLLSLWNCCRRFEFHSRYGCACALILCLFFFLCRYTTTYMIQHEMFEVLTIFLISICFCGELGFVNRYTVAVTRRCSLLLFSGSLFCIQVCLIVSIFRTYAVQDGMHGPWRYRHIAPLKRR